MSPGFADVLALWDAHHLNNAQKVCVPLLCLLADMLRCLPADAAAAQGFVHLQLDGLARTVLQRRMRAVYSHLTSGIRVRHNCALALLSSVAARSRPLAWEVFRNFDFTLATLPKLANPPRQGSNHARANANGNPAAAWAEADALALPTRHLFVRFALSFFEIGDPTLARPALAQKVLLGNVLRHIASDPPALASRAMRTLRDRVLSPDGGVPARLRAALCGDAALEQLAGISGVNAERSRDDDEDDVDGVDDAANAAETAHDILTRLCLDPAHGLCPASALGRWDGPERSRRDSRELSKSGSGFRAGSGAGASGAGDAPVAKSYAPVAKSFPPSGAGKRGATLVRLLRKLRPTESRRHAELLLSTCDARPQLAAAYLPHATYSLDPRPSVPWLAAAMLLGKVAASASHDPTPPIPPPDAAPGEAEGLAVVRAAVPPSLSKAGLTRGLQHPTGLVRHATLCLLLQTLRAIRGRVARLEEAAREAAREAEREAARSATSSSRSPAPSDAAAAFAALAEQARRAALTVLPDPQALLAVHAARRHAPAPPSEVGRADDARGTVGKKRKNRNRDDDPGADDPARREGASPARRKGESAAASGLNRIHALNALAGYADLVGAEGLAEAKVDPARLLPASPLRLPPAELAAVVGVLSAAHGVASRRSPNPDDEERSDQSFDRSSVESERLDTESVESVSASASASAAAAARTGADASRAPGGSSPLGHLLGVLRVASAAPSEGIRRDAAALAGAHLATCGALDSPATAAREAGAWVSRLPASPPAASEAACQFLAEAAGAAARRRGVDADAAANAVQRAPPPVAGWPRAGAGAGSAALPAGATGEDLEFSGLVAGAVAASVKVLGSAKRTRLQRLAVASYVAAVLFDVVQQQEDPIPLATLILCAYRDGRRGTRAPGAGARGGLGRERRGRNGPGPEAAPPPASPPPVPRGFR